MRRDLDRQLRLIHELERAGRLDRALEFLPDDGTIARRWPRMGAGLVRPELAISARLCQDVARTPSLLGFLDLPDAEELVDELRGYFPEAAARPARCADGRPPAAPGDRRHRGYQ